MSTLDLDVIKARWEAATRGPWFLAETETYGRLLWSQETDYDPSDPTGQTAMATQYPVAQQIEREADAVFIGSAIEDVPALVAEVERLQALESWLREQVAADASSALSQGAWRAVAAQLESSDSSSTGSEL